MGINNILNNALKTKWTLTDDFSFFFSNNTVPFPTSTNLRPEDLWSICTINIDLPQVSASPNTVVMGQEYRFWVPLHNTFTFTVTFRDIEKMKLKEYFTKIWVEQQKKYFDDIKSNVKITAGNGIMFETNDCLISNISQSQLDNANSQVIEFSVEFVSKSITNNTIKDFSGWEQRK